MNNRFLKHWPVILLVAVVTLIFAVSLVCFRVRYTEHAYVLRFQKPVRAAAPGLHLKWPWPVETVWVQDNRIHIFQGQKGQYEEVFTADEQNVVMSVYFGWRIGGSDQQLRAFRQQMVNIEGAEERLTGHLRDVRSRVVGQYDFDELINVDPEQVHIQDMEEKMLEELRGEVGEYGIEVVTLGVRYIGLPEKVSQEVSKRMIADRKAISEAIIAEGEGEARAIIAEAEKERKTQLANAQKQAKEIRGEGDAQAARHYQAFEAAPELAKFIRRLESIRGLSKDSVIVVGRETVPFDILDRDAIRMGPLRTEQVPAEVRELRDNPPPEAEEPDAPAGAID